MMKSYLLREKYQVAFPGLSLSKTGAPSPELCNPIWMFASLSLVAQDRGGDSSWQHIHQDREPKPVCATFHQPSGGD